FDTMLEHQGEGSGTPTEPHHTPFPEADTSHPTTSSIPLPSIPTAPIPPVTQPDTTPIRQYSRRARIAQSSALPSVVDEPASPVRDVSEGEACPTDSGFIEDQDRATIAKSSALSHDSAPRDTSPAANEGIKFQAQEEEIVKLKERVKVLEDKDDVSVTQSGDDAPIKGRSINEGEAAAERISNDSKEIARVLTSMDAATVLARGIDVPTGSSFIPTDGPPATVISTGSEVARELEEQQEKENMRMNEQIVRDAEVARIHAEEELQGMIDSLDKSNETIVKYLQEYQYFASELPLEKRIELISDLDEDFIPMGSKEETERLKRKRLNLEQEQVKKKKSSEEAPEIETFTEDVTEEKIKEMMQLVPVEDFYNFIHAPVEWKLCDLSGVHHLTAKDKEIFMLVEKDYPLRKGLTLVMISYKLQGRIVGNKMHKAFSLLVRKFPLPEGTSHCLKMNATVRRIEMPLPEVCNAIEEKKKKLRLEMPLPEVCTAIEEKKKKLPVKDRWQLH
nr:hypothetical protein [Tanacetum cinerariifolium]